MTHSAHLSWRLSMPARRTTALRRQQRPWARSCACWRPASALRTCPHLRKPSQRRGKMVGNHLCLHLVVMSRQARQLRLLLLPGARF